jgi:hypothetical protein
MISDPLPPTPPAPFYVITPTYNPYDDETLGDSDDHANGSADKDYSEAEVAALEKSVLWTDGDSVY